MAHLEKLIEAVDLEDTSKLATLRSRELKGRALMLATQADCTAELCDILRELKSREANFNWHDENQSTLFHRLARTLNHDWALLSTTFKEVFPEEWLRVSREAHLQVFDPAPRSMFDRLDSWISQRVVDMTESIRASLFELPFERKDPKDQTALSIALDVGNLPFAKIAWDYNNQLSTLIKNQQTRQEQYAWMCGIVRYTADEQGKELIDWLMNALKHESERNGNNFIVFLNQELYQGASQKWFGHFITHSADFGPLTKLGLFNQLKQHGYTLTTEDLERCAHYNSQITDYAALCQQKERLAMQVSGLSKTLLALYVDALRQWILEKLSDETRGLFSSSSSEPQKKAEVVKLRQNLSPLWTSDYPEVFQVLETGLAEFATQIMLERPKDAKKIEEWLAEERSLRVPAVEDNDLVLVAMPPAMLPGLEQIQDRAEENRAQPAAPLATDTKKPR